MVQKKAQKKIAKIPARAAKRERTQKKAEPQVVLPDAVEQAKRVSNMNRDKEKYALVNFENSDVLCHFKLVNVKDGKHLDIKIKSKKEVSCSCMDWKMRCKKNNLICKHIIYIQSIVLKVDHSVCMANKVSDWSKLEQGFKNIKINYNNNAAVPDDFKVREDREITAEDLCAICLTDFMSEPKENILCCVKCNGMVHSDCMVCWKRNAVSKGCVYCRDPKIANVVG